MSIFSPTLHGSIAQEGRNWPVLIWLSCVLLLLFAMIIVGGLTRLTDSGLSITEWKPVTGAIPPLNAQAWAEEFDKYRAIPEYQLQNRGMSLAEFQFIYWWEWGHRQLGRAIGLVYALPLFAFWLMGRLPTGLKPRFLILLALGGLQGFVGWWMVASGLTHRVDVSQYRLAAHLGLAFVLFGALVWTWADVWDPAGRVRRFGQRAVWLSVFALAVFAQIILGAFVAGLDAGRIFTDWPLMDGGVIPQDYGALTPWWRDAFENRASVQFHHRMGGYLLAAAAIAVVWTCWRAGGALRKGGLILGGLTLGQVVLGVITLVHAAPLSLSAAHQGMAALLFAAAIAVARASRTTALAPNQEPAAAYPAYPAQ